MKTAATLLLLLAIPALAAMTIGVFNLGAFENGSVVFLAADTVNVRSGPGTDKIILDNLPAGFEVTVAQKTGVNFTVNGLTAPWYLVNYTTEAGARSGYIWGGFLSLAALPVQYQGRPALILLVVKSAGANGSIPVQAMIASGGRIVYETQFNAIGRLEGNGTFNYSVSAALHGGCGFTGIANVIEISFNYPACGYPFGVVVLMYDGKRLIYGARAVSMIESGVYRDLAKFIYPDERGGVNNSLVSVENVELYDRLKKSYRVSKTNRTVHAWDGAAFSGAR